LAILTLTAAILLGGCDTGTNTKDTASAGPRKQNPEEGWQIESLMSESGKVKGKLRAPYMLRYQKSDSPYAEFPRSLHVDFFKDSVEPGKPIGDSIIVESRMDAKYGKYLQNQNKVFLRDSVVVKNILKGDTLYCKELWWDQATQKFFTDKPVEIYTKEKILFGTGMEADQNFRWYTITHLTGSSLMNQSGKETK
jgi:LPS export ABC transporter protein LptC